MVRSGDLIDACRILFDSDINYTSEFLQNLEPSALKVAYRRKALETHPDRSLISGASEEEMEKRFKEVSFAYEILRPFAEGSKAVYIHDIPEKKPRREKPAERKDYTDHYFKGRLPDCELLIGQYLYYSCIISWKTLIRAVTWQRKQRPLFGQIAKDWGILSPNDISRILLNRKYRERIGECALRKGYITPLQRMAIIGMQNMLQRPIGSYFVENSVLSREQINELIKQNLLRNMKIRRSRWPRYPKNKR